MTFCHACGAPLAEGAAFCVRCGAEAAPPHGAPATSAFAPTRPTGATVEPWVVVLLALVTFQIYAFFFWWRVTKETDAFAGTPGYAHKRYQLGLALMLAAVVAAIGAVVVAATAGAGRSASAGADPFAGMPASRYAGFGLLLVAAIIIGTIGFVLQLTAYWRVWTAIAQDESARRHPRPLSPGLMLLFMLLPYVNLITTFVALHRTQRGLDEMWAAEKARPAPLTSPL